MDFLKLVPLPNTISAFKLASQITAHIYVLKQKLNHPSSLHYAARQYN